VSGQSVIDEPLYVVAAESWLHQQAEFSTFQWRISGLDSHSTSLNGFEAYLAFYMRHIFEKPQRLDTLFTFRQDFAKRSDMVWKSQDFELVVVSKGVYDDGIRVSTVTPSGGPSDNICLRAASENDVLDWLATNKKQFVFCFPTTNMGPDIMFFIRSKETQKLLLVVLQAKRYDTVDRNTLLKGVRTVAPSWFWKSRELKVRVVVLLIFVIL
jgi:hypothetical protein